MIRPHEFETTAPAPVLTAAVAVKKYLNLRTEEGMLEKSDTYRHLRKHLAERFCDAFGSWPLSDVSTEHLREWGRGLRHPKTGAPMGILTRRHHLIDVKTFFHRSRVEGWIMRDPAEAVVLPAIEEKEVNFIPVRDAFEFFKRNRESRAVGRLALEAFGGLRYSSAGRIVAEDLKFDREGIEMPSSKHKSRRRKFRQGQPANLWTWLRHAPAACWTLTFRQYAEEKKEMLVMSGLRPLIMKNEEDKAKVAGLKNVWRHSFATYLLAKTKNFQPVAYLMQHTRFSTTEIYEGRGEEADAHLYFSITPSTVLLSWEEFVAKHKLAPPPPLA